MLRVTNSMKDDESQTQECIAAEATQTLLASITNAWINYLSTETHVKEDRRN